MKIAAVSKDGISISQHFGRAPIYVVATVEEGKIVSKETRVTKLSPYSTKAETIADCQVLLAGGMSRGAYERMKSYNIKPVLTDVDDIEEAVTRYAEGTLIPVVLAESRNSARVAASENSNGY